MVQSLQPDLIIYPKEVREYTPAEVAILLNISMNLFQYYRKKGILPAPDIQLKDKPVKHSQKYSYDYLVSIFDSLKNKEQEQTPLYNKLSSNDKIVYDKVKELRNRGKSCRDIHKYISIKYGRRFKPDQNIRVFYSVVLIQKWIMEIDAHTDKA